MSWLQGLHALMDKEVEIKAGLVEDQAERFPVSELLSKSYC